jgi:2'-5' RNA ligase
MSGHYQMNADKSPNETGQRRCAGEAPQMRVFVGVKVAPEIASELARLARVLEGDGVRLVAPGDVHLTLVPPWNEESIEGATEKLRLAAESFGPLALAFRRLCYGPEPRRPRLLWAECAADNEITELRDRLLHAWGRRDERPFRPHVTLARIKGNGSAIARRRPIDQELSFIQHIESIELFRSPPPGERGYQILASCRLIGAPSPS